MKTRKQVEAELDKSIRKYISMCQDDVTGLGGFGYYIITVTQDFAFIDKLKNLMLKQNLHIGRQYLRIYKRFSPKGQKIEKIINERR